MIYRLGTRKSLLAMTQSRWVERALRAHGIECALVPIVAPGDRDRRSPLYAVEDASPGLFTKHLEDALLDGRIDLAVHSLKDLPTVQPEELTVACIPQREASEDCLLVNPRAHAPGETAGSAAVALPLARGARVGTSSLRREAELLAVRPDLAIEPVRGNVPSRVEKVERGELDAVVFAEAGLRRLALSPETLVRVPLPAETFVPAPGQGALGVEIRADAPAELKAALAALNRPEAERATRIERKILRQLEGGCSLPLGVLCSEGPTQGELRVLAFLGRYRLESGKRLWSGFHRFDISGRDDQDLVAQTVAHFQRLS